MRRFAGKTKNFTGENFWVRGYFVTPIGFGEEMARAYVRNQDKEDAHYDPLKSQRLQELHVFAL